MAKAELGNPRVALFTNAQPFGRTVLESLREQGLAVQTLVLPEFPPARQNPTAAIPFDTGQPDRFDEYPGPRPEIVYVPRSQQAACAETLRQQGIEFILVACWPYRIEHELIKSAGLAALNLHPSLLPKYRGADPITAQLRAGDRHFGISLHLLDEAVDRGDIVAQTGFTLEDIGDNMGDDISDERQAIEHRAARLGGQLFIQAVSEYDSGWQLRPQARRLA